MTLREKISRWLDRRELSYPEDWGVTWSKEGFALRCRKVEDAEPSFQVRWADVDSVDAFQIDLLTIDGVVLEFACNEKVYEVMQDAHGWEEFAPLLSEYLPGSTDFNSWYRLVTRTAFDENRESIYRRKSEAQSGRREVRTPAPHTTGHTGP